MIEGLRVLIAVISEYLGVPDEIVFAVTITVGVLIPFFSWLFWDGKKRIELEVSNFKKHSEDGVVWKGERIPIDLRNHTSNVRDGLVFLHPITGKRFSCRQVRGVLKGENESYIRMEYSLVGDRVEVELIAYLIDTPFRYRKGVDSVG